jgi:hypothetical protein
MMRSLSLTESFLTVKLENLFDSLVWFIAIF